MSESTAQVLILRDTEQQSCKDAAAAAAAVNAADSFLISTTPADEECLLQAFEPCMVERGLSQLGQSGPHQAYCRLEVTHTDLSDPQPVAHCQHVQELVLAHNCLTTLQPLGHLQHLTSLDASHNQLSKVLDYAVTAAARRQAASLDNTSKQNSSSNLRKADLSYNSINEISSLAHHSNLSELNLSGNQIQRLGRGLEPLQKLKKLDLSSNSIRSCQGLHGLCSLQQLALSGNLISSLQPLSELSALQVLTAAHNHVTNVDGIQGLTSLRRLDLTGNRLRRIEVLAACRGLTLLTGLSLSGNPLQAAQDCRLHVVHLLTQLQQLDGVEVTIGEKVDACNVVGAATDGLAYIRKQFFPYGELEDGGGAVPPTAAGLRASSAEEECSCADPTAMFGAIDRWARAVQPSLALQPAAAGAGLAAARKTQPRAAAVTAGASARQSAGSANNSRRASSATSSRRASSAGSNSGALHPQNSKQVQAQPGGLVAVAARLAAGCCHEAPYRQLQLLRACYCWVMTHVQLPRDCDLEGGAELVTWDVGRHLFGERQQQVLLHQVLLPGYSGTWAECVSQLLVSLLRACQMEGVQLSGFWKAGGQASVAPGQQLATHNHTWVAAKVNGRWRLLDPVYALVMAGRDQLLPFFLPPEAFIHTHLPFEPCWQLLPEPVRAQEWWQRPELSLGFAAAGGQLMDDGALRASTLLQLDREVQALPVIRIPIAAPVNPQQQLCVSLLDDAQHVLASWQDCKQGAVAAKASGSTECRQHTTCQGCDSHCSSTQLRTTRPVRAPVGGCCLVYQQQVLGAAGQLQAQVGADVVALAMEELWVAFPGPGVYVVKVEQLTEVPGGLVPSLHIEGLDQPMSLALRQCEQVLRMEVVVQDTQSSGTPQDSLLSHGNSIHVSGLSSLEHGSSIDANSAQRVTDRPLLVAALPQPQHTGVVPPAAVNSTHDVPPIDLQLVIPQPGTVLEADRSQDFEVVAPASASVAVGSQQSGWVPLQQCEAVEVTSSGCGQELAVYRGTVVLPRISTCYVAVQSSHLQVTQPQECAHGSCSEADGACNWLPALGLHVWPPVLDVVAVPELQCGPDAQEAAASGHGSAANLLAALDVDGDGAISRRDMLLAFRRDRQLADHMKMPAKIKAGDGTFDIFTTKFISINRSGLGYIGVHELEASILALSAAKRSSSCHAAGSRVPTATSSRGVNTPSAGRAPRTPCTQ